MNDKTNELADLIINSNIEDALELAKEIKAETDKDNAIFKRFSKDFVPDYSGRDYVLMTDGNILPLKGWHYDFLSNMHKQGSTGAYEYCIRLRDKREAEALILDYARHVNGCEQDEIGWGDMSVHKYCYYYNHSIRTFILAEYVTIQWAAGQICFLCNKQFNKLPSNIQEAYRVWMGVK